MFSLMEVSKAVICQFGFFVFAFLTKNGSDLMATLLCSCKHCFDTHHKDYLHSSTLRIKNQHQQKSCQRLHAGWCPQRAFPWAFSSFRMRLEFGEKVTWDKDQDLIFCFCFSLLSHCFNKSQNFLIISY